MNKAVVITLSLFIILCAYGRPKSCLKETIPVKDVWSIATSEDGSKIILRFQGQKDASHIITYQNAGLMQIIDARSWNVLNQFEDVRCAALSSNSMMAGIIFDDESAHIIDLEKNSIVKQLSQVQHLAFSPNNKTLMAVFSDTIHLFDVQTWQPIKRLDNTKPLYVLYFSPDSTYMGAPFNDGTLRVMNVEEWNVVQQFAHIVHYGFRFSPDNKYLALVNEDNHGQFIDVSDWSVVNEIDDVKHLLFSRNGKYLRALLVDDTLQLIDLKSQQVVFQRPDVFLHRTSKDGKYLWIVFKDMSCQVIDIQSEEVVVDVLPKVEECAFCENKKIMIALQDEIRVYELD